LSLIDCPCRKANQDEERQKPIEGSVLKYVSVGNILGGVTTLKLVSVASQAVALSCVFVWW